MPEVLQTLPQDAVDFRKFTSNDASNMPSSNKPELKLKLKPKLPIILGIVIFLGVLVGFCLFSTLVAYGKIKISNPSVKGFFTQLVMSIPFMPKTPEYLIGSAITAHKKATTMYIDTSLELKSDLVSSMLAVNEPNLTFQIKGPVDYTDSTNIKSHIQVILGSLIDAELTSLNKKLFVKLNALPDTISALGIDKTTLLDKWVVFPMDASSLGIEVTDTNEKPTEKVVAAMQAFLEKEAAPKAKVTTDVVDGKSTNKLHLDIDPALFTAWVKALNSVYPTDYPVDEEELAKYFDSAWLDLWFNTDTKFLYKGQLSFTSSIPAPNVLGAFTSRSLAMLPLETDVEQEKISVIINLKLDKVGEAQNIDEPSGAVDIQTLLSEIMPGFGTPALKSATFVRARDEMEYLIKIISLSYADTSTIPADVDALISLAQENSTGVFTISGDVHYAATNNGYLLYCSVPDPNPNDTTKPYLGYEFIKSGSGIDFNSYNYYYKSEILQKVPDAYLEDLEQAVILDDPLIDEPGSATSPFGKYVN